FSYAWSGACTGNGTNGGGLTTTTTVPSTPGSYFCRIDVTDANGDTAAAGVTIVVNSAGVGAGGEVLGETADSDDDDDSEEEEEDGEVLGVQNCEETFTMSGSVLDNNEEGVSGIRIRVYYFDEDGNRKLLRVVSTDSEGEWEVDACPGRYEIE